MGGLQQVGAVSGRKVEGGPHVFESEAYVKVRALGLTFFYRRHCGSW